MSDKPKKTSSRGPRKKITAKSVHNNLKIDFFSEKVELDAVSKELALVKKKKGTDSVKKHKNLLKLLNNKDEYEKVKENSERLFDKLLNFDSGFDLSELLVIKQDYVNSLVANPVDKEFPLFPVLNHTEVSSYGLVVVEPSSKFGPFINTRGIMVLTFISLEDDKVFFENLNAVKRKKVPCQPKIQVLVIPNDVFVIYNESADVPARLLAISCKKKWEDFNDLKHKKVIPLESV